MLLLAENFSFYIPILLALLYLINGDVHENIEERSFSTSVVTMTNMLKTQRLLIKIIDAELSNLKERAEIIRKFLEKTDLVHKKSKSDPEKYLSNPLNAFALMRRTFSDWFNIWEYMHKSTESFKRTIAVNKVELPTRRDLYEATVGMERIRRVYNLNPMDIAEGRINGVEYNSSLSAFNLFTIGFELFKMQEYDVAVLWFNASLHTDNQSLLSNEISRFDPADALILYLETMMLLGRKIDFIEAAKKAFDLYPESDYIKELRASFEQYEFSIHQESMSDLINFEACCRENCKERIEGLSCRYNTTMHAFHLLAPTKMEELSIDPFIVLYYDVLTDDDIKFIKKSLKTSFSRALVHIEPNTSGVDDHRTSHHAGISLPEGLLQKIAHTTGFDSSGFEYSSVLNYGLGGHYSAHHDFFYPEKEDSLESMGDRIATILIYLNNVKQGGATAFPGPELAIYPQTGSLLLWYNLKNSGYPDIKTMHGACPVIVGSKWVLTIWVREKDQFRTMPCYNP